MLPEPGSPEDWLRYARSDLAVAGQVRLDDVLAETLCFHAQQAVEKSIKAVLVSVGVEFPKTHNIEHLVDMLPAAVRRCPELQAVGWLTVYATILRYPGAQGTASVEKLREAVRLAEAVLAWASAIVGVSPTGGI
ncbi:MAG: HEPN domain-containing protein [Armatimonadota bacterium]|jgi:HEPN domain-containing protein